MHCLFQESSEAVDATFASWECVFGSSDLPHVDLCHLVFCTVFMLEITICESCSCFYFPQYLSSFLQFALPYFSISLHRRFGEEPLHSCEVMLRDIEGSARPLFACEQGPIYPFCNTNTKENNTDNCFSSLPIVIFSCQSPRNYDLFLEQFVDKIPRNLFIFLSS